MVGLLVQIWFLLFISFYLYFDDSLPSLVRELSITGVGISVLFCLWQNKKIKNLQSYLFIFSSVGLILYTTVIGVDFFSEPISRFEHIFRRIIFYISVFGFCLLYKKGVSENHLVFYTVLASSHIYIYRQHYSAIAILFYLVSNLYLLKKIYFTRKNVFDFLVFLLITSSIVSTYISFFYNGTNSVIGFFYLFSGTLLYFYFKFLKENEFINVIRYILFFNGLVIGLYLIYLLPEKLGENIDFNILKNNPSSIGGMISICFPILLVAYLFWENKFRLGYLLLLVLSWIVLYFIQSFSAVLGVTVSSLFILTYFLIYQPDKKRSEFIFVFISVFSIGFLLTNSFFQPDTLDFEDLSFQNTIWTIFLERVFDHSLLFGFGSNNEFFHSFLPREGLPEETLKGLSEFFAYHKTNPHAHNLYIQFFYNYGIYGLLVLSGLLFFSFLTLAKKLITKSFTNLELIAYSILISIFFQEMFDYTMIDPVTYFPVVFAIGIISRSSFEFNLFSINRKYFRRSLKFFLGTQFFMCLFISMLGFNLTLSEKIKYLFKGEFSFDHFSNLSFHQNLNLTEEKLSQFRKLDSMYLPINIDDKKEQFSGQVYLESYKKSQEKRDLELAEKNFSKCILIFPNSAVCYKKLAEVEIMKSNLDMAEYYFEKYKSNDPFGLVKE